MAKRKRLTPADPDRTPTPAPEVKSAFGASSAPIASVAGEASAVAALEEVSQILTLARTGGRMVVALDLEEIDAAYLTRDRVGADDEEMAILKGSLAARGQQNPIEVVELEDGRYGLISGWRRLMALRALAEEGAGAGQVDALIRTPASAGDAYVAMVEENEIRADLSYFERARIALKAVEQGVFSDSKAALLALFSTASRAKRSKIRSFLPVVAALDGALAFPNRLTERLGLKIAKALEADPKAVARLRDGLAQAGVTTAEAEQELLAKLLKPAAPRPDVSRTAAHQSGRETVCPGVDLEWKDTDQGMVLTFHGVGLDPATREKMIAFLRQIVRV